MKHSHALTAVLLAAGATLGSTAPAAAEEAQGWINPPYSTEVGSPGYITPAPSIHAEAMKLGATIPGKVHSTNGVPFAQLDDGRVLFGNGADPVHTRTWNPFTDQVVYVPANSSTAVRVIHAPDAAVIRGSIGRKFLAMGGEDKLGRTTGPEVGNSTGGASQEFRTPAGKRTVIYWSSATGSHPVTGGILSAWQGGGGARTMGYPVGAERVLADGRVTQTFQRVVITWEKGKPIKITGRG